MLFITALSRRFRRRSSRRVDETYPHDLSTRRVIRTRFPHGSWTSVGSFRSSLCVRSFFVLPSLIVPIQAELVMNTHMMVLDLRRGVLTDQEGTDDQHRSVSATSYPSAIECSPPHRLKLGQLSRIPRGPQTFFCTLPLQEKCLPHDRGPVSDVTN